MALERPVHISVLLTNRTGTQIIGRGNDMEDRAGHDEIGKSRAGCDSLVHNYQPPGIRDIADNTGDSPELSRAAATMDGDVIIFCGVNKMA